MPFDLQNGFSCIDEHRMFLLKRQLERHIVATVFSGIQSLE